MPAEAEGRLGEHHFGELRQETAEAKAQGIIILLFALELT